MIRGDTRLHGTLLAVMAIWGLNLTSVKALTASFDPPMVALLRMIVASVALTGIVRWQALRMPALPGRHIAAVLAASVLMVYGNQLLFATGMALSSATNGAMINALSPLVSTLLAAWAFHEKLTRGRLVGIALAFAGVVLIVLHRPGAQLVAGGIGDLLLLASVVTFAAGGLIVQRLARKMDPLHISWLMYLAGTAMIGLHSALTSTMPHLSELPLSTWPWMLVLYSGAIATAFGNVVWNRSIATLGVARTALYLYFLPIFGVGFAILLLGEPVTVWHLVGLVVILAGTWLATRK